MPSEATKSCAHLQIYFKLICVWCIKSAQNDTFIFRRIAQETLYTFDMAAFLVEGDYTISGQKQTHYYRFFDIAAIIICENTQILHRAV